MFTLLNCNLMKNFDIINKVSRLISSKHSLLSVKGARLDFNPRKSKKGIKIWLENEPEWLAYMGTWRVTPVLWLNYCCKSLLPTVAIYFALVCLFLCFAHKMQKTWCGGASKWHMRTLIINKKMCKQGFVNNIFWQWKLNHSFN